MTHSPLTTKIDLSYYNGESRRGNRPQRLIIHHMASTDFWGSVAMMKRNNDRDSCSTYAIGLGQVVCLIDEDFKPSSTGTSNDLNAITVETRNVSGGPDWPVEALSLELIAQLAADLSRRYGWGRLQKGTNIRWHSEFNATACPGNFIRNNLDNIVNRANELLGGGGTPAPAPSGDTYTVVRGDTLSGIGNKTGKKWQDIAAVNGIGAPYTIHPGQKLKLPGSGGGAPSTGVSGKTISLPEAWYVYSTAAAAKATDKSKRGSTISGDYQIIKIVDGVPALGRGGVVTGWVHPSVLTSGYSIR